MTDGLKIYITCFSNIGDIKNKLPGDDKGCETDTFNLVIIINGFQVIKDF